MGLGDGGAVGGGSDGRSVVGGLVVGTSVGGLVGAGLGGLVGVGDGGTVGTTVGSRLVGSPVGGLVVGVSVVGTFVGVSVGGAVGVNEGVRVGVCEGWSVGRCVFGAPARIPKLAVLAMLVGLRTTTFEGEVGVLPKERALVSQRLLP